MDFTFRQLEIFRAVVVAGSITKASHRIGLSQPSISQQLAKLEESLGVQLINRNRTGSVSLTPAGEFWYRSAQDLTERTQAILQEHDQTFRPSNLAIKLGVTPALRGRFMSAVARIAQPRAYRLPYSDDLKIKVSDAMGKIAEGQEIQGKVDAEKALPEATAEALAQEIEAGRPDVRPGRTAGVGERIFQFEPSMLTFSEGAAPVTPAKPP